MLSHGRRGSRKNVLALLTTLAVLLPASVFAKPALCTINQNGVTAYSGRCNFQPMGANGSFSITTATGADLLPGVRQVSLSLDGGVAEVRGLTASGINSRWGSATRNTRNPACWDGADFQICAYQYCGQSPCLS
jgi:hypothetical protein